MSQPRILALFVKLCRWPAGDRLFSRLACFKAPYFNTIRPRITVLEPGRCVATMRDRRAVRNHLGTVHAIAMCNLAELAGGLMTDATIPSSMRWIPKGMSVDYLKKAEGPLCATATPSGNVIASDTGYDLPVSVDIRDQSGESVFRASIRMWVSPRRSRPAN
ncbi:hotdog fold domain-containing protein [Xanthomonadaceae bacterium JHOS43]|nr:hotdog fold domain-containing protein [Xanthomonadaceae bacterium JHOS43]MCX7562513.1 hotdog fold domain-containing protein [Xanthomonadaceae bacterium XH05]